MRFVILIFSLVAAQTADLQPAWALFDSGKYPEAEMAFQRVVADWPKDSGPRLGLALTQARLGRVREGMQTLDVAKGLSVLAEDKLDYHVASIRLYTLAKPSKDWLQNAQHHFSAGRRINSAHPELFFRMAQAYLEANDNRRAAELFAKVVKLNGSFAAEAQIQLKRIQGTKSNPKLRWEVTAKMSLEIADRLWLIGNRCM